MTDWISQLFEHPNLLRMGHGQRAEDLNLGFGWLYYAVARVVRPTTTVVIGSFRGFVPMVLAKAVADNTESGQVYFIDPSLADDFWKQPEAVTAHFAGFGLHNIRHFQMTTQQFVETETYRTLPPAGVVFIDGFHSEEQARFDYEAFKDRLAPNAIVLFHDSVRVRTSKIYGPNRLYEHRVKCFIDTLKQDASLQVFDFPFFDGVTLVRKAEAADLPPRT